MNKKIEDAFKQAYNDVPSQDNEGYTPDRGSFKSGFVLGAEWALREAIEQIKEDIERYSYDCQESKKYGTNSAGFNQDLGALEASKNIKESLEQLFLTKEK